MGRVIHDTHAHGTLSMANVLAQSSNIGAIQVGLKVGDRELYRYVRKFGFGRKTGVDLPGESPGILRKVENWTPTSIGSVAMGQEVSVTSLQLALAAAAVANGALIEAAGAHSETPNGSHAGTAGVCSAAGRVTSVMPPPARVFRTVQHSWAPREWGEDGPWMRLFRNARVFMG